MAPNEKAAFGTDAVSRLEEFFAQGPAQLLATDVDGTVLTPDHQLTDRTFQALYHLRNEKKVPIVFATGKMRGSLETMLDSLEMDEHDFTININGLMVYDGKGNVLQDWRLDIATALAVARECWAQNIACCFYCGDKVVAREVNAITEVLPKFHESAAIIRPDLDRELQEGQWGVNKMIVMAAVEDIPSIRANLNRVIDPNVAAFTVAIPYMLELMPSGASKAVALKRVCTMMGVDISRAIAFGDGDNDCEMLKEVGCGCAMGNGSVLAKNSADVIVPSNTEDGLAQTIERYML
eukprot:comp49451_c0_seq1/m.47629 comp49451_c0_seq1/g.47629  ORF comp49451_c0_seq1/g.47629 comp49451_c0_seq1/m.47629 type:complete len:294 (-) comp49451_c0_seq1:2-883(-)